MEMIIKIVLYTRIDKGDYKMGLFSLKKKTYATTTTTVSEQDAVLDHILKVFFDFKGNYTDKIVSIGIYPSKKVSGYVAFDIIIVLNGKVNHLQSKETSEMLEFFEIVDDDGSFQTLECTRNTFEDANNSTYVDKKLKAYVKHFMQENPSVNFDLSKTGAQIRFW